MKPGKFICILAGIFIISGCTKHKDSVPPDFGKVQTKILYSNTSPAKNSDAGKSDQLYTQFGEYITSITPTVFRAKFHTIRFADDYNSLNTIEVIDNNLPAADPRRSADFTNGSSVTLTPQFYGDIKCSYDMTSCYFQRPTTLKYFLFRLWYFYQEVQLPQQYASLPATPGIYQFGGLSASTDPDYISGGSLINNYLITKSRSLLTMLYPSTPVADVYVFGNTDRTYEYYAGPDNSTPNPDNLMREVNTYVIRSNKYNSFTFDPPADGVTKIFTTTISFDYNNLIQIYAGEDNIPYTSDDVFVYAPNYWERLSVNVEDN